MAKTTQVACKACKHNKTKLSAHKNYLFPRRVIMYKHTQHSCHQLFFLLNHEHYYIKFAQNINSWIYMYNLGRICGEQYDEEVRHTFKF